MKSISLKLGYLLLTWSYDVLHVLSDGLYYFEHGKTPAEAAREFLKDIHVVSAHEAKEMFLKNKKGVN